MSPSEDCGTGPQLSHVGIEHDQEINLCYFKPMRFGALFVIAEV